MAKVLEKETILYKKMIDAQYEYFSHIEKSWSEKFANETKDFMIDTTHWAYKIFFQTKNTDEKEEPEKSGKPENEALGTVYRALCLLCHPDKSTDERAAKTFSIISELYENKDFDTLKNIEIFVNSSDVSIYDYVENLHKSKFIEKCTRMGWYIWYAHKNAEKGILLREIIVDKKVGLERVKKEAKRLEKENEFLEKDNARMREEIKRMNELREQMEKESI